MAKLTVYGTPISTYVRTVRLLLEEIGADYSLIDIDIFNGGNNTAEYRAKNPFGKIPTLEIDGEFLYEAVAITTYLNATLANNKFSPSDPMLQARMYQIISIVDSYLYGQAIGCIVIQRLIAPVADEDKVKQAVEPVQTALTAIESIVVGSPFLLGNTVSLADLYLIPIFVYLSQTPEFASITAQTPKLLTWWENARQLPSLKKVCA